MNNIFKSPRALAFLGLMLGITIIMDISPLGMIPLGTISATIIHIPTIITGIVLGPVAGFIMGTSLGIIGWIHALTRSVAPLDPLFMNPLVSVLPRMFIGVVAYYVYFALTKVFRKAPLKNTAGSFFGGVAGSLTNTGLVFLMLYLVYAKEVVEKVSLPFGVLLIGVLTTNAVAEALISGIITLPVAVAWFKYQETRKS